MVKNKASKLCVKNLGDKNKFNFEIEMPFTCILDMFLSDKKWLQK